MTHLGGGLAPPCHPLLKEKYREPSLISYMYRRGKSLTDILVKAKLLKRSKTYYITKQRELCLACQPLITLSSTSGVPPARSLDRTTVLSWVEIGWRNNSGSCTWQHFPGPSPGNLDLWLYFAVNRGKPVTIGCFPTSVHIFCIGLQARYGINPTWAIDKIDNW